MGDKPREMPESKNVEGRDIVNLSFQLASIHAACVWPFTRSGFGTHAFSGYPWSLLLMLGYAAARPCPAMQWYIPAWLLMVLYRRATADRRQHSKYQGAPWLFKRLNTRVAFCMELFTCFFAAIFAAMADQGLADFLLAETVSLLAVMMIEAAVIDARRRAKRDAQHQARWMNEL